MPIDFIEFRQMTPSATWVIAHKFAGLPISEVSASFDGVVEKVVPLEVVHTNGVITMTFSEPLAGVARVVGERTTFLGSGAGSIDFGSI